MKRPMNSKTAIACAALCLASASTSAALRDYVYTADWTDGLLAGQQARGLVPAMAVPEPGTYALLSMGLAAVSLARQRHRKTLADR